MYRISADDWFFETAIKAIKTGDPSEVIEFILDTVKADLLRRFHRVQDKRDYDTNDVAAGRSYVQAYIGFVVYTHKLYQYLEGGGGHRK